MSFIVRKPSKLFLIFTAILFSHSLFAIGLGDLTGKKKAKTATVDSYAVQSGLVNQYVKASTLLNTSQTLLADAFGLNEQVALLKAEQESLASGSVSDEDSIERNKELTENVNQAISEKIQSGAKLDEEGKKKYQKAILPYISGLIETKGIVDAASSFASDAKATISSASMFDKVGVIKKLEVGMYIVKEAPGYLKGLWDTSQMIFTYAKDNEIETPKDATAELDGMF